MLNTQARQTEYKRVVYRSKSEAMFAACLDYMGVRFEYEPEWLRVGNWIPDFAIFGNYPGYRWNLWVVEYKPADPTSQYLDEMEGNFRKLSERFPDLFTLAAVMCGSMFESCLARHVAWRFQDGEFSQVQWQQLMPQFVSNDALDYAHSVRFDLGQPRGYYR